MFFFFPLLVAVCPNIHLLLCCSILLLIHCGGSINELVTWICSSCGLSCSKHNLSMFNLSTSSLELGLDWGLDMPKSDSRLVSSVLCIYMSPSPIFIWSVWLLGWGMQNVLLAKWARESKPFAHLNWDWHLLVHVCCVHISHCHFWGIGPLIFKRLYMHLFDHMALILPEALFHGLFCVTEEAENWKVLPLFHGNKLSLLWSCWYAWILCLREGKCVTFLLHIVNIMDSVMWYWVYPFNIHTVHSTSTMSISKFVLIDPKRKSQTGLISCAISVMITFIFKHFLFENLLMLM